MNTDQTQGNPDAVDPNAGIPVVGTPDVTSQGATGAKSNVRTLLTPNVAAAVGVLQQTVSALQATNALPPNVALGLGIAAAAVTAIQQAQQLGQDITDAQLAQLYDADDIAKKADDAAQKSVGG